MTPEFSNAIDPIFLYVLRALEEIDGGKPPSGEKLRREIWQKFSAAEAELGQRDDWKLAEYALATWIDELLIDTHWPGQQDWVNNALEFEFFREADAYSGFYERAEKAMQLSSKDALEVFYLCVVMGFRGMYRDGPNVDKAEEIGAPTTVELWIDRAASNIRSQSVKKMAITPREGYGSFPLDGKLRFLANLLGLIVLIIAAGAVAIFGYGVRIF